MHVHVLVRDCRIRLNLSHRSRGEELLATERFALDTCRLAPHQPVGDDHRPAKFIQPLAGLHGPELHRDVHVQLLQVFFELCHD